MEECLFERILFKKDVFADASDYLKNYNKIFILTSPQPQERYLQFFANVLNEKKLTFWFHTLPSKACVTSENVLKTCAKIKNADILVAFGAGTVTDITKLCAQKMNLPYIVIPTSISHIGLFNNVAYLKNGSIPSMITTALPDKVFVDEGIMCKSPESFVLSSASFLISLSEFCFEKKFENKMQVNNKSDIDQLENIIQKTDNLLNWLSISKQTAILNLADYIIEASQIIKDNCVSSVFYALMLEASTLKNNFGERCLIASNIIFKTYHSFISEEGLIIKNTPDRDLIVKNIEKNMKNDDIFEKFIKKTQVLLNNDLFIKLEMHKDNLSLLLDTNQSRVQKFSKKLYNLNSCQNRIRMIDENKLFETLSILPYLHSNYLLEFLTRCGHLNIS